MYVSRNAAHQATRVPGQRPVADLCKTLPSISKGTAHDVSDAGINVYYPYENSSLNGDADG